MLIPNEYLVYNIKQLDGEAPALEIGGNAEIRSSPSLTSPLRLGVAAPNRVLSMGQIELLDYLNWPQNNLTVSKKDHYEVEIITWSLITI